MNKTLKIGLISLLAVAVVGGAAANPDPANATVTLGATSVSSDGALTLTSTSADLTLTTGTNDVVITGSAANVTALTMTAGNLVITDSDASTMTSADGTGTLLTLDNAAGVIASGSAVLKLDAGGAIASGGHVLKVDVTGTPASGAIYTEFDFATFTDTNENVGVFINAGSKKVQALKIDADPIANDVAYIHSDAAIASDKAVLNLNSAGDLASGGNVLRIDVTGTPNAAARPVEFDFAGLTATNKPDLVYVDGGGIDARAMYIDADPTTKDAVTINSDGVIAADKGALQIVTTGAIAAGGTAMRFDVTGTPDADARVLEFDLAGVTDTNEPYGIFVDAGGKKVRALHIDADPIANDVAYIHSDAVIAADKGVVRLTHATGASAAGSAILRITESATPNADARALEIDAQKDMRAVYIDSDAATNSAVVITGAGAIADNTAMLEITSVGTPAAAGSNLLRIDASGATNTAKPVLVEIYDDSVSTGLSVVSSPTANDVAIITAGGALTDGNAGLTVNSAADLAAGGMLLELAASGTTPNADARALEIDAQKNMRAIYIDNDSTTNDSIYVTHSGNLASGKAVLHVTDAGDPAAITGYVGHFAYTGTGTNTARILFSDGGGKDVTGLYVDTDTATASATQGQVVLYDNNAGALGGSIVVHQDSASPAANDQILAIRAYGEDDGSNATLYGQMTIEAVAVTDGSEEGGIKMGVVDADTTIRESFYLSDDHLGLGDSAAFVLGSTGSYDLSISTNVVVGGLSSNEPKIVLTDGAAGDVTITAGGTSGEIVLAKPVVHSSTQALSGAGAVDLITSITEWTTTGSDAGTLADGVEGQIKFIILVTDGGDGTLTPTNLANGTTIVFGDANDAVILLFTNGNWYVMSNEGCTVS